MQGNKYYINSLDNIDFLLQKMSLKMLKHSIPWLEQPKPSESLQMCQR